MLGNLQIDELAAFSDTPAPSVTRILYSEKDALARRYLSKTWHFSLVSEWLASEFQFIGVWSSIICCLFNYYNDMRVRYIKNYTSFVHDVLSTSSYILFSSCI